MQKTLALKKIIGFKAFPLKILKEFKEAKLVSMWTKMFSFGLRAEGVIRLQRVRARLNARVHPSLHRGRDWSWGR